VFGETSLHKSPWFRASYFASFLLAVPSIDAAWSAELADIIGSSTHVHAEWTKHRKWIQGSIPIEDYLNNTADITIRPDQSFSGTFDESVKSWSQSLSVEGNFKTQTFSAALGFYHVQGTVLLARNSVIMVHQIGKAIEKFELDVVKRNGAYVCTVRDDFMKQRGASVEIDYNGVVEHHDGPEPIVSSTCKID
jgi:virulence-associated protein VapD